MSKECLIRLDNVGCSFKVRKGHFRSGVYEAFRAVTFDLSSGETLGIIGRNGAGKSTLLKILARILTPNVGTIKFRDHLTISLLALQLGFSIELSGRSNAMMGGMLLGYTRKEVEARMDRIIDFSGLGAWIDEPVRTYSTGMAARLGFSVAIETSPDVLLVDEVLGVGDEEFRRKSFTAIKEKMHSGQTVVFVSHDTTSLRELCTRVIWLEGGVVRMQGEPIAVIEEYLDDMHQQQDK